ncbi:MAG: ribosomal protection-like ABC-F family protein, partial [Anaerolineales bacterium]
TKSYGLESVLAGVTFSLTPGQRVGLVGPNGSGKSTLLRIAAGLEAPDAGTVQRTPARLRVGYLPQGLSFQPEERMGNYLDRVQADPAALAPELERLAQQMAANPAQPDLEAAYDDLIARLSVPLQPDAGRVPATLKALGLQDLPMDMPVAHLSGGQKTRLALAGVLLDNPQLLLLDEPTNHLDIGMLEWLENWLNGYPGAALLVSHDRAFLDRTVNIILELDPHTRTTRSYAGNFTAYLEQKIAEAEQERQAYSDQQLEIARLHNSARQLRGVATFKRGGKADSGDKFAKGFFGNRSAGTVGRAKNLERRLEHLLTEDRLEKPRAGWQMKLDFGEAPASGQDVVVLEDLSVGYLGQPLASGLNAGIRRGARVALVGPNGAGKTTLVRTIAGRLAPVAGRVRLGARVRPGYMAQEQEMFDPELDALQTIQKAASLPQTEARAFLHYFLFAGDDVFKPVGTLSYGERARLALARLVVQGCNLLLLDEPINHLDIPSRAGFEQALESFEGTVLAVVHDRYFVAGFATEIWTLEQGQLRIEPAST